MSNKTNIKRKIAKYIVLAQVASDGGKRISDLRYINPTIWEEGYDAKDDLILSAIKEIQHHKNSGCYFHIAEDCSLKGNPNVVYFNYKINGKRYQISFHTFSYDIWKMYGKNITKNCITHWDKKSSRDNALTLYKEVVL